MGYVPSGSVYGVYIYICLHWLILGERMADWASESVADWASESVTRLWSYLDLGNTYDIAFGVWGPWGDTRIG